MRIAGCVLAIAYAALMAFAAVRGNARRLPLALFIAGAACAAVGAILTLALGAAVPGLALHLADQLVFSLSGGTCLVAVGMALISLAAYLTGRAKGTVHASHHVVRAVVEVVIVVLCCL